MDQRSTSAAATEAGDQPLRSACGRSCSCCGPARSRSCAGSSHACATDALCCVPYVVTLLRPAPKAGHRSGYDAVPLYQFYPGACPIFKSALTGVKSGTYAAVFCYATDRLSRSPVQLALIAEECQKCEVELVFVTEPLDSSPEGQLLTFVRGWAAQLEREKIKDRTVRGKASRMASGRLPQGTGRTGTAYGYRYDKATGRRTIEPAEALVITELFEQCATGLSTYKLADRLNQAELPSPLGAKWHPRAVLNILRNPIYMGVTYFNRTQRVHISGKRHTYVNRPQSEWAVIDGATPAIVETDLFRTVQARLDQPRVRPVPEYTRYLLSGFLRCSCGGPACGHELQRNSNYRYYRCINTVPRTNRPRTATPRA